jgi:hypothetical protein
MWDWSRFCYSSPVGCNLLRKFVVCTTPWRRVLLGNLIVPQLVNKLPRPHFAFYRIRRFIAVFTRHRQRNPVHTLFISVWSFILLSTPIGLLQGSASFSLPRDALTISYLCRGPRKEINPLKPCGNYMCHPLLCIFYLIFQNARYRERIRKVCVFRDGICLCFLKPR